MVVTKTLDANAGSIFIFFNDTGTNIPNNPATIIFKIIETPISNERLISLNQSCTITAVITAKIIPFKIPITNSFPTTRLKLLDESSFVAIALIVTASVCIPALPPIEATIGIRKARATICSIEAPNLLITHVASKAVNKFSNNQLNLFLFYLVRYQ